MVFVSDNFFYSLDSVVNVLNRAENAFTTNKILYFELDWVLFQDLGDYFLNVFHLLLDELGKRLLRSLLGLVEVERLSEILLELDLQVFLALDLFLVNVLDDFFNCPENIVFNRLDFQGAFEPPSFLKTGRFDQSNKGQLLILHLVCFFPDKLHQLFKNILLFPINFYSLKLILTLHLLDHYCLFFLFLLKQLIVWRVFLFQ
jgi:hypothetical protein